MSEDAAMTAITGSATLAQLLGRDLAAELLQPGAPSQSPTQTKARQAADSVLLSPEAQALLQTLQTATLTTQNVVHGNTLSINDISTGQPTASQQSNNSHDQLILAEGFDANGQKLAPGTGLNPSYNIHEFTRQVDPSGGLATTTESLSIGRDAGGTLSIYLAQTATLTSADGAWTTDGRGDQITIDPAGHVTFNQTDSVSGETTSNDNGATLSGETVDLRLQDTAKGTSGTLTVQADSETVRGHDIESRSATELQISASLSTGQAAPTTDDIALQLLKSYGEISHRAGAAQARQPSPQAASADAAGPLAAPDQPSLAHQLRADAAAGQVLL